MAEHITIPIATFEINITYTRPVINLWLDRGAVVQKMFDVFQPWNLSIDDVEGITTGRPSEQGVKVKLPSLRITFFFGPASCKFTKEAATWPEADETFAILNAALGILVSPGGVELGKRSTSLALHLQPKNVPFQDLLSPFLAPAIAGIEGSRAEAMAYIVRWKGRRITLDGSAAVANGVYAHLERDFEPAISLEEMRAAIVNDEATLFKLLNVVEVAP